MDLGGLLTLASCLKKLKCTNCNNYLSYFPIYVSENNHNICGRCYPSITKENVFVEIEAYENIAQCIRFPCRFAEEGCVEKLLPADTPQHENHCRFKKIACPTSKFTQCTWEGALSNIYNHCKGKHFDIILKNGEFEFDMSKSHTCANLIEYNSLLFIVTRKYFSINKCLTFSICNITCDSNKKSFLCEIIFRNESRNLIIQCSTSAFEDKKITEIFLDSLRDSSNECFTISAQLSLERVQKDPQSSNNETLNEKILSMFKCAICHTYTLPPICQNTTVTCSDCTTNYPALLVTPAVGQYSIFGGNSSPATSNIFGTTPSETSNNKLDEIAGLLNYPCKNHKSGCDFISKPDKMMNHLLFCSFATHWCPLAEYIDCKWTGLGRDIGSHFRGAHQNMIVNNDSQISEIIQSNFVFQNALGVKRPNSDLTPNSTKSYLIPFSDHFFLLNFADIGDSCFWTVQFLGDVPENFMYELEIIDQTESNRALMITQRCTSLTKKDEMFLCSSKNSFCYFQKQQLQSFISKQVITFRIKVFK